MVTLFVYHRIKNQVLADDSRSAKPLRANKIESKRRESREKFKKGNKNQKLSLTYVDISPNAA